MGFALAHLVVVAADLLIDDAVDVVGLLGSLNRPCLLLLVKVY